MEFRDNKSIYLQIAEYVINGILLEKWKPEERIPSVRDFAVQLEVNPNTVMRAFEQLQAEEVIFNKRGLGYFVSADAADKIKIGRRNVFLRDELPTFFRTAWLLDIGVDELVKRYQEFIAGDLSRKILNDPKNEKK